MALVQKTWNGVAVRLPANRAKRRDWPRAFRAMDKLLQNGEDTVQAFEIIEALSGRSTEKSFRRFLACPAGCQIFARREELAPLLDDHARFRAMPAGSFGRAYLDFVSREGLSAQGLVEENRKLTGYSEPDPENDLAWFARRNRDTHDLWHVLTGYGRDGYGELALLAFSYSQTRSLGSLFIAYFGARADRKAFADPRIMDVIWEAKRAGRRAAFLPAADYLALFEQPLEDVRKQLGIHVSELYKTLLDETYFSREHLRAA